MVPYTMQHDDPVTSSLLDEAVLLRLVAQLEALKDERDCMERRLHESEAKYAALVEQSTDVVLIAQDGMFQFINGAAERLYGYSVAEMMGMPFLETLVPECRDMVAKRHEARIAGREAPSIYEARIQCKDGTQRDAEISVRLMSYKGRSATLASVRDITHRKQAEEKILQRSRELAALHNVLMSVAQTLDLPEVLHQIVYHVGESLSSVFTRIVTVNEDGSLGIGSDHFAGVQPSFDDCQPREVIARILDSGQPLVVNDVNADGDSNPFRFATGIRSYAGVPIRSNESTIGVLLVHSREPSAFLGRVEMLSAFANQAAIAMQNARLYQSVCTEHAAVEQLLSKLLTAQEDERRRLALDLHDTIGQSMYGVLAHIGAAEELLLRSDPGRLQTELLHAKRALESTLSDLRRVANGLHPPTLVRYGLVEALRRLVQEFDRDAKGVSCSFEVQGNAYRLRPESEIAIYRMAQEALNNARKHAEATAVAVHLGFSSEGLHLRVNDNGKGFQFSRSNADRWASEGHLGLAGMMERAELLGGTLHVKSRRGGGAEVRIFIPDMAVAGDYPRNMSMPANHRSGPGDTP